MSLLSRVIPVNKKAGAFNHRMTYWMARDQGANHDGAKLIVAAARAVFGDKTVSADLANQIHRFVCYQLEEEG